LKGVIRRVLTRSTTSFLRKARALPGFFISAAHSSPSFAPVGAVARWQRTGVRHRARQRLPFHRSIARERIDIVTPATGCAKRGPRWRGALFFVSHCSRSGSPVLMDPVTSTVSSTRARITASREHAAPVFMASSFSIISDGSQISSGLNPSARRRLRCSFFRSLLMSAFQSAGPSYCTRLVTPKFSGDRYVAFHAFLGDLRWEIVALVIWSPRDLALDYPQRLGRTSRVSIFRPDSSEQG